MNRKSCLKVAYLICQIVLNSYIFHNTQIQVSVCTQLKHHKIISALYCTPLRVRWFATSPCWEHHLFYTLYSATIMQKQFSSNTTSKYRGSGLCSVLLDWLVFRGFSCRFCKFCLLSEEVLWSLHLKPDWKQWTWLTFCNFMICACACKAFSCLLSSNKEGTVFT